MELFKQTNTAAGTLAIIAAGRLVRAGRLDHLLAESGEVRIRVAAEDVMRATAVLAPAGDLQKIKDATFQPVMDLLKSDLDVQVFVYDKDAPPPKG